MPDEPQTGSSDGPPLGVVMLELAFKFADFVKQSFSATLSQTANQLDAEVLFNERLEEGPYQRVAGFRLSDGSVGLVFLHSDGRAVSVRDAREDQDPEVLMILQKKGVSGEVD